ncbi:MAG: hypothetical protein PSY14_06930 [bacterium]|nr:hypothetical protein [bacterium]
MSDNRFDFETRLVHFRRFVSRLYKRLKHLPLTIADISVIHVVNGDGTIYQSRRGSGDNWSVYRIARHSYEGPNKQSREIWEKLRDAVSLRVALDELTRRCPQCLTSDATRYNHPAQVLKLLPPDAI